MLKRRLLCEIFAHLCLKLYWTGTRARISQNPPHLFRLFISSDWQSVLLTLVPSYECNWARVQVLGSICFRLPLFSASVEFLGWDQDLGWV